MSGGYIKKSLVEIVAYVFTEILTPPLLFYYRWFKVALGKGLELLPKYGRTGAQGWP